jgi:hypothetical protein
MLHALPISSAPSKYSFEIYWRIYEYKHLQRTEPIRLQSIVNNLSYIPDDDFANNVYEQFQVSMKWPYGYKTGSWHMITYTMANEDAATA